MAMDRQRLLDMHFDDVEHRYTRRDTMLYALGLGIPDDPLDPATLRYVYEQDLVALPTMAVVLGSPGFWYKDLDTGVDWKRMLHGEQGQEIFAPLPPEGVVVGRTRVVEIFDRGDKGAILLSERTLIDKATDRLLARVNMTMMLRGDGGCGGPSGPVPAPHSLPDRPADLSVSRKTLPQAALIYRLSGDYNPLHADPAVAKAGGFSAPILHGLCTYGISSFAVTQAVCDNDVSRLRSINVRFTSPVYPGETIRTDIWRDGNIISYRSVAVERDVQVLGNGRIVID